MNDLNNIVITELSQLRIIHSYPGHTFHTVCRKNYALLFCSKGRMVFTHHEQEYVCDPSHAVLLPKEKAYSLRGEKNGYFPLINFQCSDSFQTDEFMVFRLTDPDSYLKACEQIQHLSLFPQNKARIMSIVYELLHRLSHETDEKQGVLAPAIKYLEQYYADPALDNTILAQKAHISVPYFHKLFRKHFGMTPGQYLQDIRIRKAILLLTGSNKKITEVAESCGFASVYHFSRAFKTIVGDTPTGYRKKNEGAEI